MITIITITTRKAKPGRLPGEETVQPVKVSIGSSLWSRELQGFFRLDSIPIAS